jgi:hypothetical protein
MMLVNVDVTKRREGTMKTPAFDRSVPEARGTGDGGIHVYEEKFV